MSSDFINQILDERISPQEIGPLLEQMDLKDRSSFFEGIAGILRQLATQSRVNNRLANTLSLDGLLLKVAKITRESINVDRCTIFMLDRELDELYSRVMAEEVIAEIRIPKEAGIAGAVFTSGESLIITDAYADDRFNQDVDKSTGYRTRNILCAPITDINKDVIGVVQAINKLDGAFTEHDQDLLETLASQAASFLSGAQLLEQVQRAHEEEGRLLDVTTAISTELHLPPLLQKIMMATTAILDADRSTLFMYDDKSKELWSQVAQGLDVKEIRFPANLGIAGSVFTTGETVNIPDAYADERFNQEVDKKTGYHTHSILCMPVNTKAGKTIGVIQVLNKNGGPFTARDEKKLMAFSAQASIAIENAQLFEDVLNIKNYNESILRSLSNGVLTTDETGEAAACNEAAARILGAPPDRIVGTPLEQLFDGEARWIVDSLNKAAETGEGESIVDNDLKLKNGEQVSVNLATAPLRDHKETLIGSMLILEDITSEKRMKGTMARYMDKDVVDRLLSGGADLLGGASQEATVFFSDIRGFTGIAERLEAHQTVSMLNDYFTVMVDILFERKGILDKFIGDAIMAVFGIPFPAEEDADNAVATAVEMMKALELLNKRRKEESQAPIHIGIGINTGEIIAGNIGSLKRMDYTVIGDGVNLAARLESANKFYKTRIIVSEFTRARLSPDRFLMRELDLIVVKGKDRPVGIYEVLDFKEGKLRPKLRKSIGKFAEGLALYRARRWKKAAAKFDKALSLHPKDHVSELYRERCRHFIKKEPPADWNGVWVMRDK